MALETRSGRRYFYRKRREGGRIISEYVGPAGSMEARLAEYEQQRVTIARARDRAWLDEARRGTEATERLVDELETIATATASIAMLASGHRRHRGQWRRTKEQRMTTQESTTTTTNASAIAHASSRGASMTPAERAAGIAEAERWNEIIAAADAGEHQAMRTIRAAYRDTEVRETLVGTLAERAQRAIVMGLQASPSVRVAIEMELRDLRAELGYKTSSATERVLIDNVVTAYMFKAAAERRAASPGDSIAIAEYRDRTLSRAHERFLRAAESLARVRRMAVPVLQVGQVNIGENQVNVSKVGTSPN